MEDEEFQNRPKWNERKRELKCVILSMGRTGIDLFCRKREVKVDLLTLLEISLDKSQREISVGEDER